MSNNKSSSIQTIVITIVAVVLLYDIVTRNRDNNRDGDNSVVVSEEVKEIKSVLGDVDRSDKALMLYYAFDELSNVIDKEPVGDTTTGKSLFDTVNNVGFYRSLIVGSNKELESYVKKQLETMPKTASKLSAAEKQQYVGKFKQMAINFKKASE